MSAHERDSAAAALKPSEGVTCNASARCQHHNSLAGRSLGLSLVPRNRLWPSFLRRGAEGTHVDVSLLEPTIDPALHARGAAQLGLVSRITPGQRPKRGSNIVPSLPLVDIFTTSSLVRGYFRPRIAAQTKVAVHAPATLRPTGDGGSTNGNVTYRHLRDTGLSTLNQ